MNRPICQKQDLPPAPGMLLDGSCHFSDVMIWVGKPWSLSSLKNLFFHNYFLKKNNLLWQNIHKTKFPILTILKCTILHAHHCATTTKSISRISPASQTETIPIKQQFPFPSSPSPWQPFLSLCIYLFFISMESTIICPLVLGLFHLA